MADGKNCQVISQSAVILCYSVLILRKTGQKFGKKVWAGWETLESDAG